MSSSEALKRHQVSDPVTRHRSRTRQFLQGLGMDAKQCGCLLAVEEWLEFWKLSS